MDLPDGVIDSPELFMDSIRVAGAAPGKEQDERDAIIFLEKEFTDLARAIDGFWEGNEKRYRMMFWTGALLGERVASRGYRNRLAQLAYDNAMPLGG
jgi:hypothetical protein